jgi:glycosyltransferase involved in cell wall biosynthesis
MKKYILFSDAKSVHTIKWLRELVKYYDIYLVSLNGYSKEVLEYIDKEKVFVLNSSVNAKGGNFALIFKYFKLLKIVKDIKPHFLNAHYLSSYGFIASLVKRSYKDVKLIQSTWGTDVLVTPFSGKINFFVAKFALKSADYITSDSYFMSKKIDNIYKNTTTLTFPFGLDDFKIDTTIQKDEFLIYSNRILSENYNIDKIIKWFNSLDKRFKLVIANSGNLKEQLESLVRELNLTSRVEFVGFLSKDEQEFYYKSAKYYISIPTSDSTSVSLLEAMKFGCYPIVSSIPVNKEWIEDGKNGSFFRSKLDLLNINTKEIIYNNQQLIKQKAIFSKSIKEFVQTIES